MLALKVVNMFGAPGSGKSTGAAGLFNLMKLRGHSVELVSEYAKDLTYAKDWAGLDNQLMILAQQDQRLRRLVGQVEYVITDSPLPTGIAYMGDSWKPGLERLTWDVYDHYFNYHILLTKGQFPYDPAGRNQDEAGAMVLANVIDNIFHTAILDEEDFALELISTQQTPYEVYNWLMQQEAGLGAT